MLSETLIASLNEDFELLYAKARLYHVDAP